MALVRKELRSDSFLTWQDSSKYFPFLSYMNEQISDLVHLNYTFILKAISSPLTVASRHKCGLKFDLSTRLEDHQRLYPPAINR